PPSSTLFPYTTLFRSNVRDFDVQKFGGEARIDWRIADGTEWINSYGLSHAGSAIELTGANGTAQVNGWTIHTLQSRLRSGRFFADRKSTRLNSSHVKI